MKHLILLVLLFSSMQLYSQHPIEIKTKPLSIFLGTINISSEHYLKEQFSIESDINFKVLPIAQSRSFLFNNILNNKGFILSLQSKYYFLPESKGGKIYIGAYTRYKSYTDLSVLPNRVDNQAFLGMLLGYKWIFSKKIILQVDSGLGRKIYEAQYINNVLQSNNSNFPNNGLSIFFRSDGFFNCKVGYRFTPK